MQQNQKNVFLTMKFIVFISYLTAFNLVYWLGIVSPNFGVSFNPWYRGIAIGLMNLLYFYFIPTYTNKIFLDIKHAGIIASVLSFLLSTILLFVVFPLQV